jgi:hypothetical protein
MSRRLVPGYQKTKTPVAMALDDERDRLVEVCGAKIRNRSFNYINEEMILDVTQSPKAWGLNLRSSVTRKNN